MKKDRSQFVSKCPNCQYIKAEHLNPCGLIQELYVPTWNWEAININFIVVSISTQMQYYSTWGIVDRLTK